MRITETFIVSVNSSWQMLFKCPNTTVKNREESAWFITSNGGFGQRDMHITQIPSKSALELIEKMKDSPPTYI